MLGTGVWSTLVGLSRKLRVQRMQLEAGSRSHGLGLRYSLRVPVPCLVAWLVIHTMVSMLCGELPQLGMPPLWR